MYCCNPAIASFNNLQSEDTFMLFWCPWLRSDVCRVSSLLNDLHFNMTALLALQALLQLRGIVAKRALEKTVMYYIEFLFSIDE